MLSAIQSGRSGCPPAHIHHTRLPFACQLDWGDWRVGGWSRIASADGTDSLSAARERGAVVWLLGSANMLVIVLAAVVVYAVMLLVLRTFAREDWEMVKQVRG